MDAKAIATVTTVIVTIIQVLKQTGLTGRWALLTAALLSAGGVALFEFSAGPFVRSQLWDIFAGWSVVFAASAGVFSVVNGGAEAVTAMKGATSAIIKSLTGPGDGRNP